MPTIKHTKEYAKTLTKDKYAIIKPCDKEGGCDLKEPQPGWKHCPYCGEEITYEVEEIVQEGK